MKSNKILVIACMTFACATTYAQDEIFQPTQSEQQGQTVQQTTISGQDYETFEKKFYLIPKVGINFSSLSNISNGATRFGLICGLNAELEATQNSTYGFGIIYSQQGKRAKSSESTIKLDYINIPIYIKQYTSQFIKGLSGYTGLQPGFIINSKYSTIYRGAKIESDFEDDIVSSFVLSLIAGLSYEYKNISFDLYYDFSLTKSMQFEDAADYTCHNKNVGLTIGYKFDVSNF